MAVQTSSAPHAKIACGEPEGVRRRSVTIKVQASKPLSRQAAKPAFPARDSCAKVALAECLKLGSGERESRRRRTGCHHHSRHGSALAPAGIRQGLAESCPDTATGLGENEPGISCQADGAGLTGRKRSSNQGDCGRSDRSRHGGLGPFLTQQTPGISHRLVIPASPSNCETTNPQHGTTDKQPTAKDPALPRFASVYPAIPACKASSSSPG